MNLLQAQNKDEEAEVALQEYAEYIDDWEESIDPGMRSSGDEEIES